MGSLGYRVSAEPRAQKGPCPSSQTGQALCVCRDPFQAIFLLPANQSRAETSSAPAGLKASQQDCDLATISPTLNPLKTPHPHQQPSQAEPRWWRPCSFWQGLITGPLGVVRFALPEGAEDLKNEMGASHEGCLLKFNFLILSTWNLAGCIFSGAQPTHPSCVWLNTEWSIFPVLRCRRANFCVNLVGRVVWDIELGCRSSEVDSHMWPGVCW